MVKCTLVSEWILDHTGSRVKAVYNSLAASFPLPFCPWMIARIHLLSTYCVPWVVGPEDEWNSALAFTKLIMYFECRKGLRRYFGGPPAGEEEGGSSPRRLTRAHEAHQLHQL